MEHTCADRPFANRDTPSRVHRSLYRMGAGCSHPRPGAAYLLPGNEGLLLMRNLPGVLTLSMAAALTASVVTIAQGPAPAAQAGAEAPPYWAYGVPPPAPPVAEAHHARRQDRRGAAGDASSAAGHVAEAHPGQHRGIHAFAQLRDFFNVADWFPGDHPPMPDVVVHGRAPDVRGCAMCHMPNGLGRPENAPDCGTPLRLRRSAALRLQERSANQRRAAQDQHRADDSGGQGDDGRRSQGRRDLPVVAQVEAVDQGGRGRHRAAHAAVRQRVLRHRRWRDRAARQAHRRNAARQYAVRAARSAFGLYRLRSDRKPQQGCGAGLERRATRRCRAGSATARI